MTPAVSYGGIYVPMLAAQVIGFNAANPTYAIPLKGILVGNGCLGTEVGSCGSDFFGNSFSLGVWRGHGLVSAATYAAAQNSCGDWSNPSQACQDAFNDAAAQVGHVECVHSAVSGC